MEGLLFAAEMSQLLYVEEMGEVKVVFILCGDKVGVGEGVIVERWCYIHPQDIISLFL